MLLVNPGCPLFGAPGARSGSSNFMSTRSLQSLPNGAVTATDGVFDFDACLIGTLTFGHAGNGITRPLPEGSSGRFADRDT